MTPPDRPKKEIGSGPVARTLGPLREFLATEAGGATILLCATVAALVWANVGDSYDAFWHRTSSVGIGAARVTHDLRHWVNEGLMTLFFLVVGLEIKRELVGGELASIRKALLPAVAALGGMVVPALLYLAVNAGAPSRAGWGIPMATDIAFAAAALAYFGRTLSSSARVFLLSLAIVDDIGAIVLIALFYSTGTSWPALRAGLAIVVALALLRRLNLAPGIVYGALACALWFALSRSGVHAAIAGVVLGLMVPVRRDGRPRRGPVAETMVHRLHPWTSYAIVPLFALANAGVELSGHAVAGALTSRVGIGIVAGLVVGKLAGVGATTWGAVRLGLRPRPEDGWVATAGIAGLAGIGFTVSLFIAELAFSDAALVARAKIAILVASTVATALGGTLLRVSRGGS